MANINKIKNPCFPDEFAEYLEANDFLKNDSNLFFQTFVKENKAIVINADRVSFRRAVPCVEIDDMEFEEYAAYEGLSSLDFTSWVYLLHAVKMVLINEVVNNYRSHFKKQIDLKIVNPKPVFNMVAMVENMFSNVRTFALIFLIVGFCSCAYHQDMYKQAGYWTYHNHHYKFHPKGDWQLLDQQTVIDSAKLFYRTKTVNTKGAHHIDYVNN